MATYHRARDLAREQERRHKRMAAAMVIEHRRTVEECKRHARLLTSGGVPLPVIRKMRPFRRSGRLTARRASFQGARIPLLPINRHTGRLQRSLRVVRRGASGFSSSGGQSDLFFTAPYAKFVLGRRGTKKMVPRGFWLEMERFSRSSAERGTKRVLAAHTG